MTKYILPIISIVVLLLITLIFLIGKLCKKKVVKISLWTIIGMLIVYCSILSIDIYRTNSLKEPIFARENGHMGSMIRYDGLGYKIGLEKDGNTIVYSQMNMFKIIIASAIS